MTGQPGTRGAVLLFTALLTIAAGVRADEKEDRLVSQVAGLSGLKRQIEQIPAVIKQQFGAQSLAMDQEVAATIESALIEAYSIDLLQAAVFSSLRRVERGNRTPTPSRNRT